MKIDQKNIIASNICVAEIEYTTPTNVELAANNSNRLLASCCPMEIRYARKTQNGKYKTTTRIRYLLTTPTPKARSKHIEHS